jgi:hypothetical protein
VKTTQLILFIFFSAVFTIAQGETRENPDASVRTYEEIEAAVKKGLSSSDPEQQEQAVLMVADLLHAGTKSPKVNEMVHRLAESRDVVNAASDIILERLAGWYEERNGGTERGMPLYYPLLHIVGMSKSKTAALTLVMALPAAGFDPVFRKSLSANERAMKTAFSKLELVESKFCCLYPGRDLVSDMQAIDFRLAMLAVYRESIDEGASGVANCSEEMKKFIADCLSYGDGKKGRIIRMRAVEIAVALVKYGHREFLPAIKKIADTDPACICNAGPAGSGSPQRYDIAAKSFPVREKARAALALLAH